MDVSIIVVTHNTREMTIECIRSILEQTTRVRYELIVFDSGSTDGSSEAIREHFPAVKLITSERDVGFGKANNIAAKGAQGRRLLLINPDTVVLDHAIDRLSEFADTTPECSIWGGRTVFADGSLNPASCWKFATLWSVFCWAVGLNLLKGSMVFNPEGYPDWKRDCVRSVDIVSGCFFLIDGALWQDLGGFDPVFFMYAEEADLCIRARKLGARPKITPTATIVHYGGASYPRKSELRIHLLAGRVTLMDRHWSPLSRAIGRGLYLLMPLTRWLGYETAAALLRERNYRANAREWHEVWGNRWRWVNGWTEAAVNAVSTEDSKSAGQFG
ncbi:N-acetylglucosaminyl-diphospho-decaprenol L-rhamnosyltransferase [Bradyrhizobium sp. GM2.2]|uniref:glycosyltransferase family 2 protein n=1 Tax=unclassified Bradyrhizobium TaxID=2631580 RepID=UPI001FFBDC2D|nr:MULTISPECIES: glycosyltransferase family 2 protein [unclassified Bradyrhizobium]MCK1267976.1 glycosyltransferase family 2 protein [Bradyrhizobium sp. 84]MCK1369797.1 glycosyltransferase family 2 protein [Bradyrhizobium sp. 49]MCK1426498.1 glycosyltransferase family 2 protein [Bradyrhizobium sp. 87]